MKSNDHKRHSHFNSHHQHKYFATSSPNYEPEKKVLLVDGENGLGEVEVTPTHSKLNVSLSKNSSFVNDYGSTSKLRVSPVPMLHLPHRESKILTLSATSKKINNGSSSSFAKRSYSVSHQLLTMDSSANDEATEELVDKVSSLSDDVESRANFQNPIPANYLAPNSHFPSRDLYLHKIKSQYFMLGLSSGASMQMFLVSFLLMFVSTSDNAGPIRELSHEYYPVFRGVFLLTFFFTLYGTCLFIWQRNKVDYAGTLGLTYAHTYQYVLRGSSTISYIIFSCFMLYILTLTGGLDEIPFLNQSFLKHLWPALAFFVPVFLFFCPTDSLTESCFGVIRNGFRQRLDLVKEMGAVFASPFSTASFRRCFIADVLCSMPKIFPDLQYTLCIYISGHYWVVDENEWQRDNRLHDFYSCGTGNPLYLNLQVLLGLLPFHIRFMQCLRAYIDTGLTRHLFNMLKYLLSICVTALATAMKSFDPATNHWLGCLWVGTGIVATIYSFYWDVVMDWGLGNADAKQFLLREELYFTPVTYYLAILCDLLMRLGWALVISPEQPYLQQHFVLMLGVIELVRRCMWAIFRVEWESIRNNAMSLRKLKQQQQNQTQFVSSPSRLEREGSMSSSVGSMAAVVNVAHTAQKPPPHHHQQRHSKESHLHFSQAQMHLMNSTSDLALDT